MVLGLAIPISAFAQKPSAEHVTGRLLVQTIQGPNDSAASEAITQSGAKVHHRIDQINVQVLSVPEPALNAVTQALQRSGRFTFVEPDFIAHPTNTPNDPNFSLQWHLATIQASSAWNITIGSTGVPIAVIDSGADSTHPDLAPKLIPGWNFLTGTSNTEDTGCNSGHGTAVSGTVGADTNNLIGVAGVGWANPIMPLVVVPSGCTTAFSDIANAITYAADQGVRIINVSIGGPSSSSALQSAVDYAWNKGAVIFASAGNNSSSTPMYPAACNNVVSVSSTEPTDTFSSFSNYGSWIDLSAPGDNILTTMMGGGDAYWYGTSFSSPIAAAVGALVLSVNPSLTASRLVSLLEQNSDQIGGAGYSIYYGYGRVNAYRAVTAASTSPVNTAPTVTITSPASGATVSGTVSVQGSASATAGLSKVSFYINGTLMATASSSPFSFSWNTTSQTSGTDTVSVTAYDTLGNSNTASVSININNAAPTPSPAAPPVVTITSPTNGSLVSKTVTMGVSVTDSLSVTRVSIYVDNVQLCSDTSVPYSCSWNTKKASSGSHTITATAWDTAGNVGHAAPITVTK